MLGLYIDRDSAIHALAPGVKMLALALSALALIAVDDWRALAVILAAVLCLFAVARLPARETRPVQPEPGGRQHPLTGSRTGPCTVGSCERHDTVPDPRVIS